MAGLSPGPTAQRRRAVIGQVQRRDRTQADASPNEGTVLVSRGAWRRSWQVL